MIGVVTELFLIASSFLFSSAHFTVHKYIKFRLATVIA